MNITKACRCQNVEHEMPNYHSVTMGFRNSVEDKLLAIP